jgi:FMN-dependent oxidoreductase (nitrilotriacetate monooxygenase family)
MSDRQLHFTAFIAAAGYHESAWRLVPGEARAVLGLPHYREIARIAEAGRLDSLFMADNIAIAEYRAEYMPQALFDPVELLSALAAVTDRIGLIATGSTTYSAPWDLARRFATLDFLSAGRAGWNIVTTRSVLTAANFGGSAHPSLSERYEHAAEFVEAVLAVWDGWEDDAVVACRETGVWADRAKLHAPRFEGEHYHVAGILPFPRSPQGHPVLVQAGSSAAGVSLAARHAELVFTRQPTVEAAAAFRGELRAQAAAAGRPPDHLHILPALAYTLGGTEAEARERQEQLEALASPEFRWRNMLWMIGLDPDGPFDPDAPLPDELINGPAPSSGAEPVFAAARAERVPLRELARRHAGLPNSLTFVGTPEQLGGFIEGWWRAGAVDGFTLMPNTLPDGLAAFVEHTLPILRRRGLFREEYAGTTLREHLGLPRPRNRHAAARA